MSVSAPQPRIDTDALRGVSLALLVIVSAVAGLPFVTGSADAAGTTDVQTAPENPTLAPNETQTFTITVPNASAGISSYDLDVAVDPSVAEITAIEDLTGAAEQGVDANVSADGSSASIGVFGGDTANGSVDIVAVTVEAVAPGSTTLDVSVSSVTSEEPEQYTIGSVNDPSIAVEQAVDYQVSNLSAPGSVVADGSFTVSATIRNDGIRNGSQTVEYRQAGSTVASTTVELEPGNSTTVTFDVTAPGSTGTITHGVYTADDNATADLTVTAPATLDVRPGTITPSAVDENTTVTHTLEFDVRNVADDGNTDTVTVIFPNSVGLSPNNVTVVDASGETPAGGITDSANVVSVAGGTDNGVRFGVSPDSSQSTRNLTFTVDVDVSFPTVESNTTVGIDARVNDSAGQSDQAEVATVTINDTETTAPAPGPATFEVSGLNAPASVEAGTEISVSATVTNTGGQQATETVEFRFDGTTLASQTVDLGPNESTSVTFTATADTAGTFTHGVFTSDDSQTAQIEVTSATTDISVSLEPASQSLVSGENRTYEVVVEGADAGIGGYDVTVTSSNTRVAALVDGSLNGEPLQSDVRVGSQGSSVRLIGALTQFPNNESLTVGTVTVNGAASGSADLGLDVTEVADPDGNVYNVANATGASATIQEPASISVTDVVVSDTQPRVGDEVTVTATVENTGDIAGEITVEFTKDGAVFESQSVEVTGDSTRTVSATTSFGQPGSATVGANGQTVSNVLVTAIEPPETTTEPPETTTEPPETTTEPPETTTEPPETTTEPPETTTEPPETTTEPPETTTEPPETTTEPPETTTEPPETTTEPPETTTEPPETTTEPPETTTEPPETTTEPPETTTEPPETTASGEAPTTTTTSSGDGGPGFGLVVTLVAIIAAGLLTRRQV